MKRVCKVCGAPLAAYQEQACSRQCAGVLRRGPAAYQYRERVRKSDGYVLLHVADHPRADAKGRIPEHIVIAERALGRYLPDGTEVHHFNEIRNNNSNHNLIICEDHGYHVLLHTRQRIVARGGDPNMEKICSACQQVKPRSEFSRHRSKGDGLSLSCRSCASVRHRVWRSSRNFIEVENVETQERS